MKKEDFDKKVKSFIADLLEEDNVVINFKSDEYPYGSIYHIDLRVSDYSVSTLQGEQR